MYVECIVFYYVQYKLVFNRNAHKAFKYNCPYLKMLHSFNVIPMHICIPTAKNITRGLEEQKGDFLRAQKKYILFPAQAVSACLTLWIIERRR